MSLRLLTLVWSSAPYKDGALLLLLALADFSNDEGVSWPSLDTLARKARMTPRHARRILREFESAGLVSTENRGATHEVSVYQINAAKLNEGTRTICPPTSDPVTPMSEGRTPTSAKGDADVLPTVRNLQEPPKEGEKFVDWFLQLLAKTNAPTQRLTTTSRDAWIDAFEKLQRIDGKSKAQIWKACEWARGDPFWRGNFYAPTKLRERKDGVLRIDQFLDRLANPSNATAQKSTARNFEQAGSFAAVTDK